MGDAKVNLFGRSGGHSTCGEVTCAICGTTYNQGADIPPEGEIDPDYSRYDSVVYVDFAGVAIVDCCFDAVEKEVLRRLPDVIQFAKARAQQQENELAALQKIVSS